MSHRYVGLNAALNYAPSSTWRDGRFMPRWLLKCPQCRKDFVFCEIEQPLTLMEYRAARKPDWPKDGLTLQCPTCQQFSMFQQHDLAFNAD